MARQQQEHRDPASAGLQPAAHRWQWLRIAIALMVISAAYFYHLDRPRLWDDEADTGILARNTLHQGVPIAYDGRNVAVYDNGEQLNRALLSKKTPWVQYYVGALSLKLFGNDTGGLRVLFALAGLLAFFPIHAVLKTYSRYPEVLAMLALISPQVVLFQRNARYYSLLILLYAALVWHVSQERRNPRRGFLGAAAILILLFHTHPVAAGCCAVSLVLYCLLVRREAMALYVGACSVGFVSWLVWYLLLGPSPGASRLFVTFDRETVGDWFSAFLVGLGANGVDLDVIGCFPALLCVATAAMLSWQGRSAARTWLKRPIPTFVLLNVLIQAVLTSALLGTENIAHYAFLRYMPHLVVFGLLAGFVLLSRVIRSPAIHVAVCAGLISVNVLTLSFWAQPSGRTVPVSWMRAVYSEILWPRETAWEEIINRLQAQSQGPRGAETLMLGLPPWTQGILIFYLGDRYLIEPIFKEHSEGIEQVLKNVLGEAVTEHLRGSPEWLVDSATVLQVAPAGYTLAATFRSYRDRPDDGARPELTRHAFPHSEAARSIRLFHLQGP